MKMVVDCKCQKFSSPTNIHIPTHFRWIFTQIEAFTMFGKIYRLFAFFSKRISLKYPSKHQNYT